MGFPIRKAAARTALIGVMLGGGLLYAGISQAQDSEVQDVGVQNIGVQAERGAELIAATGGPAASDHLIAFNAHRAAVEVRDDDVAAPQPGSGPATGQARSTGTPQPTPVSLDVTATGRR